MYSITELCCEDIKITDRTRAELGDLRSLMNSIQEHGVLQPILVNEDMTLLAGERRLTACKTLKLETIPARVMTGIDPGDAMIIEWIENVDRKDFTWAEEIELKLRMHKHYCQLKEDWGYRDTADKLQVSLGGLSSDLTIAIACREFPELTENKTKAKCRDAYKKLQQKAVAFNSYDNLTDTEKNQFEELLEEHTEVEDVESLSVESVDAAPEIKATVPKFIYKICSYEELLPKLPNESVGFAELDPPWAIEFDKNYGKASGLKTDFEDWTVHDLTKHMKNLLPELYKKLLPNSWVLCWTGIEHWMLMNELAFKAGFGVQKPGFWYKDGGSVNTPKSVMISDYETFLLFRKNEATFNTGSFRSSHNIPTIPASKRYHIMQKPKDLYRKFFKAMHREGTIFFSPFAGSGQSMIVSTFYGMTPVGSDTKGDYYPQFYQDLKNHSYETVIQDTSPPEL